MKIAIVHDWLTGMRGGERVLESFIKLFPESDLFTLLHKKDSVSPLIQEQLKGTSFLNYLPHVGRYYRYLLPVFPLATRILSEALRPYDLVISLSHAAAKNVRLSKFQYHLIYCFTPMRYIWDQASTYFGSATPLLYPLLATLRNWDKSGGNPNGRSKFIAISKFISARIRRFYGQDATVIYPPVRSEWLKERQDGAFGEAFLYAGALVSYKRPDLVVKAFNELGLPLWVVGRGELEDKLRGIAASNVKFLGALPDNELAIYYRDCRALVFPAVEDSC
jgi:glycosyltransferase involved in cell wall biosynthesis